MPKDEWGVKRVCPSCNDRFYDLQKDPLQCPYCAAEFSLESLLSDKPKIEKSVAEPKADEAAVDVVDDDADVLDDDADIDVDDNLLDADDDDDVSLEEIADVAADDDDS